MSDLSRGGVCKIQQEKSLSTHAVLYFVLESELKKKLSLERFSSTYVSGMTLLGRYVDIYSYKVKSLI